MGRTYKVTGINLKSMPLGEADRLLTILTREQGLLRAVATGARKQNSKLGGRSELFVVNEWLIAQGRSLDKVLQAETLESYPGLGQDLRKLTASQYLAEICLCQALSEQPQEELFYLLNEHLKRIEQSPSNQVLAHLTHGIFQLLVLAGIAPQVHLCCVTQQTLTPDFSSPDWRVGFSIPSGGTVSLAVLERLRAAQRLPRKRPATAYQPTIQADSTIASQPFPWQQEPASHSTRQASALNLFVSAAELALLQPLNQAELPQVSTLIPHVLPDSTKVEGLWRAIEQILRHYAQYHFDRTIRSATLIDACFGSAGPSLNPSL